MPVTDDREFFESRGFGRRIGFGRRPAVLSVDFMRGFTDPAVSIGSDLDREIAQARRVLDVARATGAPVFHTAISYDDPAARDAGVWRLKNAGVHELLTGSTNVELDPRIERRDDEQLIVKRFASAFFGTDLASRLVSEGVDTVIVVGCTTSGCIRASVVDAIQSGFRPIVVREAVGDRSQRAHEQSLLDMHHKYADVVAADEVLEELAGFE